MPRAPRVWPRRSARAAMGSVGSCWRETCHFRQVLNPAMGSPGGLIPEPAPAAWPSVHVYTLPARFNADLTHDQLTFEKSYQVEQIVHQTDKHLEEHGEKLGEDEVKAIREAGEELKKTAESEKGQ